MTAAAVAESWIRSTLLADATLVTLVGQRVYPMGAPEGAVLPYVVYWLQNPIPDVTTHDGVRVLSELIYEVVGVDTGLSSARVEPIAQRIDLGLHRQRRDSAGIIRCVRRQEISLAPIESNVRTLYRGGLYCVYVESANPN